MLHVLFVGLLSLSPGAPAAARAPAPAAASTRVAPPDAPAPPASSGMQDAPQAPPLTAYDRQLQAAPGVALPEVRSLTGLALRVLCALVAVVALIYATLKGLLPRYYSRWSRGASGARMQLVERLALDGQNAVVLLRLPTNEHVLLGTGTQGVHFLTRLAPAEGADFGAAMATVPGAMDASPEVVHAAAH